MRVYVPVERDHLQTLVDGGEITVEPYVAASTDEEDELAALEEAAEHGAVAAAAELDDPDGPVTLADIASLHVDLDDSGDLAWFATQEIAAVVDLVGPA